MMFWRSSKDETIATQRELIEVYRKNIEELKALFNMKSNFEIVEQTEEGVALKMKPLAAQSRAAIQTGRAGFRARRIAAEEATKPAPQDSVAALEKRVREQKEAQNAI